jgi:hypothetical protein
MRDINLFIGLRGILRLSPDYIRFLYGLKRLTELDGLVLGLNLKKVKEIVLRRNKSFWNSRRKLGS